MGDELLDEVAAFARALDGSAATPEVLSTRHGDLVVRVGSVVAKAHSPATQHDELAWRMDVAARASGVFLAPLAGPRRLAGRLVSAWPYGEPVRADAPDAAPWEAGAELLARLHRTPLPARSAEGALVEAGGPGRVREALARLRSAPPSSERRVVEEAALRTPLAASHARRTSLTHGDWHLGQLVSTSAGWRLIDVDDAGGGDPAWDLARPAALYAAGLLEPDVWRRFLDAYRAANGAALAGVDDEWAALDVPGRALTVQMAALAITKAAEKGRALDEVEAALVDACGRIARLPPPSG